MKFNVNGEQFTNALIKLNSVIPTRSTLPILDNIYLKLEGKVLHMLASDLEIFVRTKIEVENAKDNGEVTIPAKRLTEICKTLTSSNIGIDISEKYKMTIKTPNGKFSLSGESAEDYPVPEEKTELSKIEMNGGILRKFLSKVVHCVNSDEIRRNMSGVLFDARKDELRTVATDGFRLSKIIKTDFTSSSPQEDKFIVPTRTCGVILRLNGGEDTLIEYDEGFIKLTFGNVEVFSKLIDDTFPNYESVIPTDNDKRLKVNKSDLMNALRRAVIFADTITKRVKISMTSKSMMVKADNPEIGAEGEETIDCAFYADSADVDFDATPFEIAFNAGYLIDCISHLDTSEINFSFSSPNKASIATPSDQVENEDFMELIMPVRVG